MAEPVYRTLAILVKAARAATGTRITYLGMENIPERGAAVVAINHTSYVDWFPACLAVWYRGRRLRVMIKAEMNEVRLVGWLIKKTKMVPVDRCRAAARRRVGRCVPRGHDQPQLRAEGVQDRRGADGQ
jgi:1-acyl-sn-glycerol-3-phosphate acyltransferase